VREFLLNLRMALARDDQCHLVDRDKNLRALLELEMLRTEIPDVLRKLAVEDYCQGPLPDDQGKSKERGRTGPGTTTSPATPIGA